MKITPKTFFSFENNLFFSSENLVEHLNEDFVLEGEYHLSEQGIDTSNIYFKLLAQLHFLNSQEHVNDSSLAHLNYIIAYYVGLFLHPMSGESIALKYINEAIALEHDWIKRQKYQELISMIKEEL